VFDGWRGNVWERAQDCSSVRMFVFNTHMRNLKSAMFWWRWKTNV